MGMPIYRGYVEDLGHSDFKHSISHSFNVVVSFYELFCCRVWFVMTVDMCEQVDLYEQIDLLQQQNDGQLKASYVISIICS